MNNKDQTYNELTTEVARLKAAIKNAELWIKELSECKSPNCSGDCRECYYANYLDSGVDIQLEVEEMNEKNKLETYIKESDQRVAKWSQSRREAFQEATQRLNASE